VKEESLEVLEKPYPDWLILSLFYILPAILI